MILLAAYIIQVKYSSSLSVTFICSTPIHVLLILSVLLNNMPDFVPWAVGWFTGELQSSLDPWVIVLSK